MKVTNFPQMALNASTEDRAYVLIRLLVDFAGNMEIQDLGYKYAIGNLSKYSVNA